jgi:hypothetical protein
MKRVNALPLAEFILSRVEGLGDFVRELQSASRDELRAIT